MCYWNGHRFIVYYGKATVIVIDSVKDSTTVTIIPLSIMILSQSLFYNYYHNHYHYCHCYIFVADIGIGVVIIIMTISSISNVILSLRNCDVIHWLTFLTVGYKVFLKLRNLLENSIWALEWIPWHSFVVVQHCHYYNYNYCCFVVIIIINIIIINIIVVIVLIIIIIIYISFV